MVDTLDDAVELTNAYIAELLGIAEEVGYVVRLSFEQLARTDRADIVTWADDAGPYLRAGQSAAADLAAGYLSEMTGTALTAERITMPTIGFDDPFLRTWHQLSEGSSYAEAKESGASVAEMLGQDVTIDGGAAGMNRTNVKVRGWRRVITAKACEWCRVVATQLYRTQASATFGHHGCRCTPVAVLADAPDPTKAINQARLRELKASGAVQRASDARERSRARERAARAR